MRIQVNLFIKNENERMEVASWYYSYVMSEISNDNRVTLIDEKNFIIDLEEEYRDNYKEVIKRIVTIRPTAILDIIETEISFEII